MVRNRRLQLLHDTWHLSGNDSRTCSRVTFLANPDDSTRMVGIFSRGFNSITRIAPCKGAILPDLQVFLGPEIKLCPDMPRYKDHHFEIFSGKMPRLLLDKPPVYPRQILNLIGILRVPRSMFQKNVGMFSSPPPPRKKKELIYLANSYNLSKTLKPPRNCLFRPSKKTFEQ